MKVTIAALSKENVSVVEDVLDGLRSFSFGQPLNFGLVTPRKIVLNKNLALLDKQSAEASVVAGYATSQSRTASKYDFLQLKEAALFFEGTVYSPLYQGILSEKLDKESHKCEIMLKSLLEQADGDYSFVLLNDSWIGIGRDPLGIQPLYFGENNKLFAIATNRKALWQLGVENPRSFPPGNMAYLNKDGFKFKAIRTLSLIQPKPTTIEEAASRLQSLLYESIRRRLSGLKEVAVAFSGGIDSSVVAFIAHKLGVKVNLVCVSMENEPETEIVMEAAEALNLPLHLALYKDSDVEETLPKVLSLIEEADPIKTAIGLPFFWVAKEVSEAGYKILLAGQGADELFGGYHRYVKEYCQDGSEKVQKTMFNDVVQIHESNLERDVKITSFHDIELRLPFGFYDLVKFALSLPIECKIEPKIDTLRKLVLRKTALDLGVPSSIVDKPKKAVQYSTGINTAVKRLARKSGKSVNEYINDLFERTKTVRN